MRQEISTERARQGKTLNHIRYVLAIGTALVIVGFGIAYLVAV